VSGWAGFVDVIENLILAAGPALGGGTALGIVVVTLAVRIALIPIMLPLGARTRDRNLVVKRMRPEMQALKEQYRKDPDRLQKEISALHARHGIKLVDMPGLLAALIQLPLLIGLFQAVYHVSEGTPLASNGLLVGVLASAFSVAGLWLGGQADSRPLLIMSLVLPVVVATWLGSGIGLYLVAFYAGSALQGVLMRRRAVRTPVPVET
jgi:YidC/Oxa1 family membrane protein insertase